MLAEQRLSEPGSRSQGIGASESAAVLGLSPFKSALEVYLEKVGLAPEPEEKDHLEWGKRLEPVILQAYADKTGRVVIPNVEQVTVIHPAHGWLRATLDADVVNYTAPSLGLGVLEAKTTNVFKADEWAEGIPDYYQVQLQHQMAVTGRFWGSVGVLIGGNCFRWADLPRHEAFIQEVLLPALGEFWQRVLDKAPPDPDASKSAMRALQALYPKDTGAVVSLDGSFMDLDKQRVSLMTEIKRLEAEKELMDGQIKAALKDASIGVLPNGVRFTWKLTARKGYVVADSETRTLRRLKAKN